MVNETTIFDKWSERYDQWFKTPIGRLIKKYESQLVMGMLRPGRGEKILDAGCGTGVFTRDMLVAGAQIFGLELSLPMLLRAGNKLQRYPFYMVRGDMRIFPFHDNVFDKAVSVTAIEFIEDARGAIRELFRVTKPGGCIVVATLNALSPWATRRREAGKKGHPIFKQAIFRSPEEIRTLAPVEGIIKTVIHFQKLDAPDRAIKSEKKRQSQDLNTGAFIAARWQKPER
jgi:ubiquinone/menaquinone biosynthesis C-methylase UbiE